MMMNALRDWALRMLCCIEERSPSVPPPMTAETVRRDWPAVADELIAFGAQLERRRIEGVYRNASIAPFDPLLERLMFDGVTPPEAAAQVRVAALRAGHAITVEAAARRGPEALN